MKVEPQAPVALFAGKYRLLRLLGKGGMGEVWLAEEQGPRNFRRRVAVKRLLSQPDLSEFAPASLLAEAHVIAHLDHPNVVRLIELGMDEGVVYLVLDYIDGPSLEWLLKKGGGALSPRAVAYIGREVARALQAVHALCDERGQRYGVVHRDISPSNILISRDGRVRLTDFGIARISGLGGEKTETGVFKGKLPYMPPEQARGEPFDGRADIFSLALTLLEALVGKRIRRAETQGQLLALIMSCPVPRTQEILPETREELARAIDAAVAFDARQRTGDAGELAAALDHALFSMGSMERSAEEEGREELRQRIELLSHRSEPAPGAAEKRPPALSTSDPWTPVRSSRETERFLSGATPTAAWDNPAPSMRLSADAASDTASTNERRSIGNLLSTRRGRAIGAAAVSLVGALAAVLVFRGPKPPAQPAQPAPSPQPLPSARSAPAAAVATEATVSTPPSAAPEASQAPPAAASATHPEARAPRGQGNRAGRGGSLAVPAAAAATGTGTRTGAPAETDAAAPGTLQVVVLPWADVSIDGRAAGTTPLPAIPLAPGPHKVAVRNAELSASRTMGVVIKAGKPLFLRIDLRRAE